jgi:hypothetical protein
MGILDAIQNGPQTHRMETRAKVLTFDIERRPGIYLSWGPRADYLSRDKQLIRSSTISFAAKWYGKQEVIFKSIGHGNTLYKSPESTPGYKAMLTTIRDLMDEADIVVGYNSIRFDEAKLRGEWARLGIAQPSPYRSVDLMRTVKRMGWDYSSLAETLSAFGLEGKTAHQGFSLWTDCLAGDPEAWALMEEYNVQDVRQTEAAYDCLRPLIKDHPNLNLWSGFDESGNPVEACCNCGKSELALVEGKSATTALTNYALVECRACGAHMRRNFVKARTTLRSVK